MSRTSTAYASDYQRTRETVVRLCRGEIRTLTADLNGALVAGETLASVTWRISQPWGAILTTPTIDADARRSSCTLQAGIGCGHVKALAVTSTGRKLVQQFRADVNSAPWFQGETAVTGGVYELTVTA